MFSSVNADARVTRSAGTAQMSTETTAATWRIKLT